MPAPPQCPTPAVPKPNALCTNGMGLRVLCVILVLCCSVASTWYTTLGSA